MDRNNLNYLVYVHTNKINGKKYVGQSSNIVERWRNGGKNYFSSIKFFRAIQKYGWENFTHEILYENLNKEAANKIERDLIRKYDSINNGYNIQEGGKSIIVINRPDSAEEFIDTYNHEKNHVEMHICKEFGIDPYSEKAAYLSGQLAKKLFKAQLKNWIK